MNVITMLCLNLAIMTVFLMFESIYNMRLIRKNTLLQHGVECNKDEWNNCSRLLGEQQDSNKELKIENDNLDKCSTRVILERDALKIENTKAVAQCNYTQKKLNVSYQNVATLTKEIKELKIVINTLEINNSNWKKHSESVQRFSEKMNAALTDYINNVENITLEEKE